MNDLLIVCNGRFHNVDHGLVDLFCPVATAKGEYELLIGSYAELCASLSAVNGGKVLQDRVANADHLGTVAKGCGGFGKVDPNAVDLALQAANGKSRVRIGFVQSRGNAHSCRCRHNGPASVSARTDNDIGLELFDNGNCGRQIRRGCRKCQGSKPSQSLFALQCRGLDVVKLIARAWDKLILFAACNADKLDGGAGGVSQNGFCYGECGVDVPCRSATCQ